VKRSEKDGSRGAGGQADRVWEREKKIHPFRPIPVRIIAFRLTFTGNISRTRDSRKRLFVENVETVKRRQSFRPFRQTNGLNRKISESARRLSNAVDTGETAFSKRVFL